MNGTGINVISDTDGKKKMARHLHALINCQPLGWMTRQDDDQCGARHAISHATNGSTRLSGVIGGRLGLLAGVDPILHLPRATTVRISCAYSA